MNWLSDQNSFLTWEIRSRDTIEVKRCYVDVTGGDLIAGILLSQIIYWHLPDDQGQPRLKIERDGYRWLAKKREDWWKECRITPKQFDSAIKLLESKNLLKTAIYKFGNSPTKHIRIDWDNFLSLLAQVVQAPPLAPEHIKTQVASGSSEKVNFQKGENGNDEKGNFRKGENGSSEKVNFHIPKMVNSIFRKGENDLIETEITTETTTEITKQREEPPTPTVELNASDEIFSPIPQPQHEVPKQSVSQQLTLLPIQPESLHQTNNPSSGSIVPGSFDNHEQSNKPERTEKRITDQQLSCLFLSAYNANKPSNFTEHTKINPETPKKD
ncbi:hypothetical protein [Nostoc sp. MG11]|uniref:hypothetical protein n=1 Tax=Nostoc sp. MG11 TaxID=2721166 RepID=UPI001868FD5E|nr:hypothetical protein [Nostoc sp. MG11]